MEGSISHFLTKCLKQKLIILVLLMFSVKLLSLIWCYMVVVDALSGYVLKINKVTKTLNIRPYTWD